MKINLIITFLLMTSSPSYSDEVKCTTYAGASKPNSLEELATDCELHKTLASDETVQINHRKNIYEKLSSILATQIKQNSEDISLLTAFYNANGQDLMMNSKEIANNCRLDSVKSIETCGGKKTGPFQDLKLSLLKQKLPKNANTPFSNDQSLYGLMAGKFYSDLGMKEKGDTLQCPLEGSSGSFMLKSQLDDISANSIIDMLKNGSDATLDLYPQLKIIKNTNDPQFIKKFIDYAKSKASDVSAKDYISKFFFEKENQAKLAPTLANQCQSINKNMNEFLCSDLTELGSLDDNTSRHLFNKLNTIDPMEDQYEVDFSDPSVLTAYGMQCMAKENAAKEKPADFQSIDQWYEDFNKNTREIEGIETSKMVVNEFCSIYSCKTNETKNLNSCKSGGPVVSSELSAALECNILPRGKACSSNALKTISYMEGLEKLNQASKDHVVAENSSSTSTSSSANAITEAGQKKVVSGRLPNFAENYFGVEGSLKALGKPVTAFEISEKKQDFAEKKLASNEPVYSTPAAMKTQVAQKAPAMTANDNTSIQPTFMPTQMSQTTTRPTFASPSAQTETAVTTSKKSTKKSAVIEPSMESSRLREEMEKMLADIKTTKKEMNEVQNNINSSAATSLGGRSIGSNSGLATSSSNRAEQERLRRLEQSLNEKANKLEEYRRELDNRNFAQSGYGSEGSGPRSAASSASGASGGNGGMSGPTGSSAGGNSVKLSSTTNAKADGKASGGNYTAAIIQSGVESSPLTVDELSRLLPENLKKLGIDSSLPFTLKVTFDGLTYQVPVKTFIYKGSKILGPIMDPKNKDLNDFLMKSPLFKQYMEYRLERETLTRDSI